MTGPERLLLTHRAPPRLLERALARAALGAGGWRLPRVALAVAAGTLLGLGAGLWGAQAIQLADPTATVAVRVEGSGPAPVHLVCLAPDAAAVAVAGTWNGWSAMAAPMREVGDGLFALDVALPAGRHEYMFVIDGARWVPDPAAILASDDGFGRRNSVIEI